MQKLSYPDMLALIADRSEALRTAAAAAGFEARVPGCPDWSVADLVGHLGEVQLFWAADVNAGELQTRRPPRKSATLRRAVTCWNGQARPRTP